MFGCSSLRRFEVSRLMSQKHCTRDGLNFLMATYPPCIVRAFSTSPKVPAPMRTKSLQRAQNCSRLSLRNPLSGPSSNILTYSDYKSGLVKDQPHLEALSSERVLLRVGLSIYSSVGMSEEVRVFLKGLTHLDYSQQFQAWQQHLAGQDTSSPQYLTTLGAFLERNPFTLDRWLEYIELTNHHEYKTALSHNPKSFELWMAYLESCRSLGTPEKEYQEVLRNAIMEVGADSRALPLYNQFQLFIPDNPNTKYEFYKKVFTRALIGLQQLHQGFVEWIEGLPEATLSAIATKEYSKAAPEVLTYSMGQQRAMLKQQAQTVYFVTVSYRDKRLAIQNSIKKRYFDGKSPSEERKKWEELVQLEEEQGVIENLAYCYDRWVLAQTDDPEVWQENFDFMEIRANKYVKVLNTLRNNRAFFLSFDLDLAFYWCDLEERGDPKVTQGLYHQLVGRWPCYQVHRRWLQFELRQKQPAAAQGIFESLLGVLSNDSEAVSAVVVEYCQFGVKQWKDVQWGIEMLRTQMKNLPFSKALLCKYLELSRLQQSQEGHYEQLMKDFMQALGKASQAPDSSTLLPTILKLLKHHLRSTLSSIYLIKLSEHKLAEEADRLTRPN